MQFVIPSSNRADRILAKDYIPDPWRKDLVIVVPPDQEKEYKRKHPDVGILACPVVGHAGGFRQWIFDKFDEDPHLCMVDDDLFFYRRTDLYNSSHLERILDSAYEQRRMWRALERTLTLGIPFTGISYRLNNNAYFVPYVTAVKIYSCWAVDRDVLLRENIRFDDMRVMEDLWVQLHLLTRGYKTRLYTKWIFNQISNMHGGCSTWRSMQIQTRGAKKLHKHFPEFVKLVDKKPKSTCWFGRGVAFKNVRIQWKKAYEAGQKAK